ncbi:DUF445 domain-containing protein [Pectinatus frisingensis]|uniref:DUF445 domain-containing protein n=1 Tax=Pectinatus frisingensis TaxID=865 RepID=UPI0018C525F2|nr:DUF445 domain-containing protein [Pectinatus frisingensis]
MKRKSQATIVLIIMAIGALVTMNESSFILSLLHNGFLAATIGGLADWFAVTAIFKKPLGISWRTAILPRNRQRIMDEIISFIGLDLLSIDNIMKDIVRYDMAKMVIEYFDKLGGKKRLEDTINALVNEIIQNTGYDVWTDKFACILSKYKNTQLFKLALVELIKISANDGQINRFIAVLDIFARKLTSDTEFKSILQPILHDIIENYKQGSTLREMAIAMFDINDVTLMQNIDRKFLSNCAELKNEKSPQRQKLQQWLKITLPQNISSGKYDKILSEMEKKLVQKSAVEVILKKLQHYCRQSGNVGKDVAREITEYADAVLTGFSADYKAQKHFDTWLKERLSNFIKAHSSVILQMIKDKLNSYSTESFIILVENHVGNDLQMIRINGSLVGGIAGMVLYMAAYLAERIYS